MSAPQISPLPDPPSRTQARATFNADAEAWVAAIDLLVQQINALGAYLDNLSLHHASLDTSASSVAFGTGAKSFTVSADKAFSPGQLVTIAYSGDVSQYMFGRVTAYAGTTLTVQVLYNFGAGTQADWLISVVPPLFDIPLLRYSESELRYLTGIM